MRITLDVEPSEAALSSFSLNAFVSPLYQGSMDHIMHQIKETRFIYRTKQRYTNEWQRLSIKSILNTSWVVTLTIRLEIV
jgi:hypothetical protein